MTDFSRLVSLACHDLRTPLATVSGFARTIARRDGLDEAAAGYARTIEEAAGQMAELLDGLSAVAKIEAGTWETAPRAVSTADLAAAAEARLGDDRVTVDGDGGDVTVDVKATERAVLALVRCALRHGGLDEVWVTAHADAIHVRPVTHASAPVVLGDDLRDLGAAVAVRVVRAQGGEVALDGDTLSVRLPS